MPEIPVRSAFTVIMPDMPGTGSAGIALAATNSAAQMAIMETGTPMIRPRVVQVRAGGFEASGATGAFVSCIISLLLDHSQ
jgi:hypothetical protein